MFPAFLDCKKRCHAPFSRCVNNNRSEEECECIQECPKVMKEVCGSDNVTYDNECLLKKAACEKFTGIEIVKKGPCTACMSSLGLENGQIRDKQISASSELDKQHAAKQGRQFQGNTNQSSIVHHWLKLRLRTRFVRFSPTSFFGQRCMRVELYGCKESYTDKDHLLDCNKKCSSPFSRCVKHKGNEEKCECIQECPKAVKQVCASDNVTYDNECLLKKTACEKEEELTLVKNGACTVPFYDVDSQEKSSGTMNVIAIRYKPK
ncbi:hypothetical protein pdam_00007371 [Pocillopora damicornis]|uniref:Kazal-like domain-containing protein n=1 Tax=Pocillopora damicornis TaxID=46731 RepID=A0A3M6V6B0_POCDA|nr:hypothetical protein pdam_00007371 [Pocillopora damicornis]